MIFCWVWIGIVVHIFHSLCSLQILKPADKKKFPYGTTGANRPVTPPRTAQGAPPKKGKK